jgi:ubiquitin C-terminal hydrolase
MNSTIQALLSVPSLALFFSANQYVQQMNEKEFK